MHILPRFHAVHLARMVNARFHSPPCYGFESMDTRNAQRPRIGARQSKIYGKWIE
jgi:hypothetical protein